MYSRKQLHALNRVFYGLTRKGYNLLSANNTKILKSKEKGYLTVGLHFAPANLSGFNTCPSASEGCKAACLNTAGHGRYTRTQTARIAKTNFFFKHRGVFMARLVHELHRARRKAERQGLKLAVRLNLTSDIQWEKITFAGQTLFQIFSDVQFYDYTKIFKRLDKVANIPNYHLTFSRSESNHDKVIKALDNGHNVAIVFDAPIKEWNGYPVIDADEHDLRFMDNQLTQHRGPVIAGLIPKEQAKRDKSGFVVQI